MLKNNILFGAVMLTTSLLGCAGKQNNIVNSMTLSETPCLDGTLVNVSKSGCGSLFWGVGRNNEVIKFRCTSPKSEQNLWNTSTFYALSVMYEGEIPSTWTIFCADQDFAVFIKTLQ